MIFIRTLPNALCILKLLHSGSWAHELFPLCEFKNCVVCWFLVMKSFAFHVCRLGQTVGDASTDLRSLL